MTSFPLTGGVKQGGREASRCIRSLSAPDVSVLGMPEFFDADLRGSRFERVDLSGVQFRTVDLSDAQSRAAYLKGAVMRGVELVDVDIRGEVVNLTINGVDASSRSVSDEDRVAGVARGVVHRHGTEARVG
jgi:uncharacterized protein YjbI with pentapeptide repeats